MRLRYILCFVCVITSTSDVMYVTGGKDSLVAWHLAEEAGKDVDIFYVCEGRDGYDKNTRIHDIAKEIGKDIHLGKPVF